MAGALEGIKIIDLGHVLAGPFCTMILADLGAEVIKVEPMIGDDSRQFGPFIKECGNGNYQSGYFINLNRNKKSICIDLRKKEGKIIFEKLIKKSDVVLENFRPKTMRKLELSYENLKKINPKIIYCSISGFGHDALAENSNKPAYDLVAQAYSGLMSVTGPENGEPCKTGTSIGDIISGHQAAIAILSALLYRKTTGEGQYIDISMVDGLVYIMENAIVRYTTSGDNPSATGSAHPSITPFQAFETQNNYIVVSVGNTKIWEAFCESINRRDLIKSDRFKTNQLRMKNKNELNCIISPIIRSKTTKEWMYLFDKYEVPCSPINTINTVVKDDQINYRNMIVEINQPQIGKMKIIGSPFHMSETPGSVVKPAPLLGEHTFEILREILDISDEKIFEMINKKIVG